MGYDWDLYGKQYEAFNLHGDIIIAIHFVNRHPLRKWNQSGIKWNQINKVEKWKDLIAAKVK